MAKEDIIKNDIVNDLKDMQEENDQSHLEPVNVVVGRFQPMSIGHLSMAKELSKINDLPSVYIYIRSKSGKNSNFSDKLTMNYMEDVRKGQDLVRDSWSMTASFIPVVIKETQRRGYNPVLIGAGEDRAKTYAGMVKRLRDIKTHPDFKIQELKGRLTSGTEVRQAIIDGDEKKFKKYTPKEVHPYYKQLKDELEKSSVVIESDILTNIVNHYNISVDIMESLLETYNIDFFSDTLLIESILEGSMSDINLIYQDTKDFDEFKKVIQKEYPKLTDNDILELYKNNKESINEARMAKLKFKNEKDYKLYHDTFSSVLDTIVRYVETNGYRLDSDEFFIAFGDAFHKPKKGKTLKQTVTILDKNKNFIGNLHASIYNRGTNNNTYELNVYTDQIKRGLKETLKEGYSEIYNKFQSVSSKENLYELFTELYGHEGIPVYEHISKINDDAINKAHIRIFERIILFRKGELTINDLDNQKEKEIVTFLSKIDETKLLKFQNYLNERMGSADYEAKIDAAICMLVKTNRPISWKDFKHSMGKSDFFKKEFKPFLMMQGLSDYQIERMVDNILRMKYQYYSNYFLGNPGLQYLTK